MKETKKLYDSISNIDNQFIEEAQEKEIKKAPVWKKWEAMAVCLFLLAVGVFTVVHPWKMGSTPVPDPNGTTEREPKPNEYPPTNIAPGFTLDQPNNINTFSAVFNDVDTAPIGVSAMINLTLEDFCSMSAEESLDYFGITLSEDNIVPGLKLTGGGCFGDRYGVYRTENRGVYYDVNFYEFTGSGKSVTLTLRTLFNPMPSPEQVTKGPEQIKFTKINGWEPALFRYTDENGGECIYTEFVLDGVTCTISACGLEKDELAQALTSVLPQKEYAADPITATGTVTHIDSRTEDYFDGVENHHSESHDYITMDCGDTHLTVWLPGEADKFTVGDIVTVTYNGEPATAYNIWPGQLVSVK